MLGIEFAVCRSRRTADSEMIESVVAHAISSISICTNVRGGYTWKLLTRSNVASRTTSRVFGAKLVQ